MSEQIFIDEAATHAQIMQYLYEDELELSDPEIDVPLTEDLLQGENPHDDLATRHDKIADRIGRSAVIARTLGIGSLIDAYQEVTQLADDSLNYGGNNPQRHKEIVQTWMDTGFALETLPFFDKEKAHVLYEKAFDSPQLAEKIISEISRGIVGLTLLEGKEAIPIWRKFVAFVDERKADFDTDLADAVILDNILELALDKLERTMRQELAAAEIDATSMPGNFNISPELLNLFQSDESAD